MRPDYALPAWRAATFFFSVQPSSCRQCRCLTTTKTLGRGAYNTLRKNAVRTVTPGSACWRFAAAPWNGEAEKWAILGAPGRVKEFLEMTHLEVLRP